MQISVTFETISPEQYSQVLDYYNSHIPEGSNTLKQAYATEGGFMVDLTAVEIGSRKSSNPNDHIKQVRWYRKSLIGGPPGHYPAIHFSENETLLLYHALCFVFGSEQVACHNILKKI